MFAPPPTVCAEGAAMPVLRRVARSAVVCLLLVAGAIFAAARADAAPLVTLSGSAPAVAHAPGTVLFTYTVVLPFDVDSAVLKTHQPVALPALTTGVTLDEVAVPSGQISQPSSVDIDVDAGASALNPLTSGTHVITFQADVGLGSAATSSTATLDFTVSSAPGSVTSAAVLVAVNQPDLAVLLTPGSGEDQLGFLGTNSDLGLAFDVANRGFGTPQTSVEIDFPIGSTLGDGGLIRDSTEEPLPCVPMTNAQNFLCNIGNLSHVSLGSGETFDVDITTTPSPPVGQVVPITVSAVPNAGQGTDTDPTNDSATAHFQFSGIASLSYTITPAKTKVVIGAETTVKLTVHNAGPQPANQTVAIAVLIGASFEITGFTGDTVDLSGPGVVGGPGKAIASPNFSGRFIPTALTSVAEPAAPGTQLVLWLVGDIPAGGSTTAVMTIKAVGLGQTRVGLLAASNAGNPACSDQSCDLTSFIVRGVAVPPASPTPTTPTTSTTPVAVSGGPALANTGTASTPSLSLGCVLVVLGAALTFLGRRRRLHDART
jgi:hypothetical protein